MHIRLSDGKRRFLLKIRKAPYPIIKMQARNCFLACFAAQNAYICCIFKETAPFLFEPDAGGFTNAVKQGNGPVACRLPRVGALVFLDQRGKIAQLVHAAVIAVAETAARELFGEDVKNAADFKGKALTRTM